MEYTVDCSKWSQENFAEIFSMLQKHPNTKVVLYMEEKENRTQENMEKTVGVCLNKLGLSPHLKGYGYIKYGILRCIKHPEDMESVTKVLYPEIAIKYDTTPGKVEHGIRHAIKKAWETEKSEEWDAVFGRNYLERKSKPTNAQFIATLSDFISINNYML